MDYAVKSDLGFVDGCGCPKSCGCAQDVYKSVWDRLAHQLFQHLPPGMNPDEILQDVDVWKDEVILVDDSDPYTFQVRSEESPKAGDVIEYKGKFYVIGAVEVPNN